MTPSKAQIVNEILNTGMVQLILDSRHEEVDVPAHLKGQYDLRLNLSGRFGLPLAVTETGIEATLTFQGDLHDCVLPWSAIYVIISHESDHPYLFPQDLPPEVLEQPQNSITKIPTETGKTDGNDSREPTRKHLRLVGEAKQKPTPVVGKEPDPQDDPPPDSPDTPRGHLRVIK